MKKYTFLLIVFLFSISFATEEIAAQEKVAHWTFDTNFTDDIGNISGVANGDPVIDGASAKVGAGALVLDGDGDFLRMVANPVFSSADITYTFWMKTPAGGQTWPGAARIFSTPSSAGFELAILNGNLSFLADGAWVNFAIGLQNDVWTHVAMVVNADKVSCYINGVQSGETITVASLDRSGDFLLGSNGGEAVIATIDDLSIFNYALNDQEAATEAGIIFQPAFWTFDTDIQGWGGYGPDAGVSSDGVGNLVVTYNNADGNFDYPTITRDLAASPVDASTIDTFYMRYQVENWPADAETVLMNLQFDTDAGQKNAPYNFVAANGYLKFDLRNDVVADWGKLPASASITRIRIELPHNSAAGQANFSKWENASLKIDYVSLGKFPLFAPIAKFSTDKTTGAAPLTVQFTDESEDFPSSWAWDFDNDGVIDATEQNPSYIFSDAGTYTVKLTATNGTGSDDTIRTAYIVVSAAPVLSNVSVGPITIGDDISVTSDADAIVYLVPEGTAKVNDDIIAAAVANASATAGVAATISTTGISAGNYILYAIDAAVSISDASAVIALIAPDITAPVLSAVTVGPVTIGDDISATSDEDATVYLVPEGTAKVNDDIIAAAVASASATAGVAATLSTAGITAGNYIVYAIDAAVNVSDASASITITAPAPMEPKWTFDTDLEGWGLLADNVDVTLTQQSGKMHMAYVDGAGGAGYAPLNSPNIIQDGLSIDASTIDIFKMGFVADWPITAGTLMPILITFNVDAGVSYSFFNIDIASGYVEINIRNNDPTWGVPLAGTITKIQIDLPHNSGTNFTNGDLWFSGSYIDIDSLELAPAVADIIPPVLSAVTAGSVTIGDDISATSDEDATLYLVPEGTAKVNADIVAAVVANASATAGVAATLSTTGISAGNYIVYAIDAAGNVSDASDVIALIAPDITAPVLSAVTAGPVTIGDDISVTSNEDATLYLVPEGTAKVNADIVAAAVANASATAGVAATLSTTGISTGNYIVYAIDEAGNISDASAIIAVEIIDAIFNNSALHLRVYPNPASDIIKVNGVDLYNAYITDITGKIVMRMNSQNSNSINVSELNSGIYFIKNTSISGETQVVRFIKK